MWVHDAASHANMQACGQPMWQQTACAEPGMLGHHLSLVCREQFCTEP